MKPLYTLLFFLFTGMLTIQANTTVVGYFDKCRKTGAADYAVETKILKELNANQLLSALEKYDTDTALFVRQQAYYLAYRKGLQQKESSQPVVSRLVKGLDDDDSGLRGRVIGYLQAFPLSAFGNDAKKQIAAKLKKPNAPHFDDLVLLAGFVGVGNDELLQLSANPDLSAKKKWNISLALARMGSPEALNACVEKMRKAPVNSAMVSYLLPDLVYTRKKAALDYCVELLYSDEKLCQTANPDLSGSILCAYPVIELIAPVITGIPVKVDSGIGIDTNDYEKMLQTVRDWFKANKNYEIKTDGF